MGWVIIYPLLQIGCADCAEQRGKASKGWRDWFSKYYEHGIRPTQRLHRSSQLIMCMLICVLGSTPSDLPTCTDSKIEELYSVLDYLLPVLPCHMAPICSHPFMLKGFARYGE